MFFASSTFACSSASDPAAVDDGGAANDTGASTVDAAMDDAETGPTCEKKWDALVTPGGSFTFEGGAMHVKMEGKINFAHALQVSQSGLSGDFDATFEVDKLTGKAECSVTAFVGGGAMPVGPLSQIEWRKTASGHDLVAWKGTDNSSKFSDAPTATLHIKRVANTLTVEGTAGTVTQSFDMAYPDLPVTIGLFAECPFEFPAEAVISKFTLTGGAPGKSDDFDCDSRK